MISAAVLSGTQTNPDPIIPVWTRDQICRLKLSLSGLMIQTKQFGLQPWFELAYQCLTDPEDRASVRKQKKTAGDTHIIIEFYTNGGLIYNEPETWLNQCYSPSMENNPDLFYLLCFEAILDGLIPVVVFDGDNGMNPKDGYPNALRQLPLVIKALGNLSDNVLYARFWDGIWYGSTRGSIEEFGIQFRTLKPNGCLAIEFATGLIQLGDDVTTYGYNGILRFYDVVCSEFDSNIHQDSTWQVVGRMVDPYNWPPDEPYDADKHPPPFYLNQGSVNSRGRYYWIPFENKAYEWVRNMVSASQLSAEREYFRNMGCDPTVICW